MSLYDDITTEVDVGTSLKNGQIIGDAFRRASLNCPKCQYPNNATEFDRLVGDYIWLKLAVHRMGNTPSYHAHRFLIPLSERERRYIRATEVHAELLKYWPCEDCIKMFNPTGRIRHVSKNFPQMKGILDYA